MISSLDHIVMTVHSIRETVNFYTTVLGMKEVLYGKGRVALSWGDQKINLHQIDQKLEPRAENPTPGSLDICLETEYPLKQFIAHLNGHNVDIIEGPVKRTGARGSMMSIYFRDPSLNLIEVCCYL